MAYTFCSTASPFSERLVRTRKALSSQIAPRILPIYTPVIHPKLKRLMGEVLEVSQGPSVDMAEKFHHFGTGQVAEQLMGQALDHKRVAILAENETNICRYTQTLISFTLHTYDIVQSVSVLLAHPPATMSRQCAAPAKSALQLVICSVSSAGRMTKRKKRRRNIAPCSKPISMR